MLIFNITKISIFLLSLIVFTICSVPKPEDLSFETLYKKITSSQKKYKMVIAGADNESILECCRKAKDLKIVDSILVGDETLIRAMAEKLNIDISDFELVDIKDPVQIARYSVKLVHDGKADIYTKGSLSTKHIMQVALDKEIGLRIKGSFINLISILRDEDHNKFIIMSDGGMAPYPTLDEKKKILENTVEVAHSIGIMNPKVAPLCAIEVVNPKMIETVEADELKKMNERGEIKGCIVDGPLSLDLALDPEAARIKNIGDRKIQGDADVLIFHNIHAGNIAYKILAHVKKWKSINVLAGTSAPIVLTSRSDTTDTKINSLVFACFYSDYLKKKNNEKSL